MATSCWCRWVSDRFSFTCRESWTDPEVSVFTSEVSVVTLQKFFLTFRLDFCCRVCDMSLCPALFRSEMSRAKNELQRTPTFMDLYHEMETMFLKPPDGTWIIRICRTQTQYLAELLLSLWTFLHAAILQTQIFRLFRASTKKSIIMKNPSLFQLLEFVSNSFPHLETSVFAVLSFVKKFKVSVDREHPNSNVLSFTTGSKLDLGLD